jgi:hypothetical protein
LITALQISSNCQVDNLNKLIESKDAQLAAGEHRLALVLQSGSVGVADTQGTQVGGSTDSAHISAEQMEKTLHEIRVLQDALALERDHVTQYKVH